MFRKSKIEPVEKVKIVERYLAGEIGIRQAGKELGVDHHVFEIGFLFISMMDQLDYSINRKTNLIQKI
mgnify:FL=1